jgi:1-acyl-sn-glycerol-3-phosphate acyltransferase
MSLVERGFWTTRFEPWFLQKISSHSEQVKRGLLSLVDHLYRVEIPQETRNNLASLEEHLKEGSAIVFSNHTSDADGVLSLWLLLENLGSSLTRLGVVEPKQYLDGHQGAIKATAMKLPASLGFTVFSVYQAHLWEGEHFDYGQAIRLGANLLKNGAKMLSSPGGVLFLAIEGTRSPDKALRIGRKGAARVGLRAIRQGADLCYVPLAIVPTPLENLNRGLNMARWSQIKFELRMGLLLTPENLGVELRQDPKGELLTEKLMARLAGLLPEEMRGDYAPAVDGGIVGGV